MIVEQDGVSPREAERKRKDASLPEDYSDVDAVKVLPCPPCHTIGYVSRVDSVDDTEFESEGKQHEKKREKR